MNTSNSVYSSNIRNKKLDKFFVDWIGYGEIVLNGKISERTSFSNNRSIHNFRSLSFPRKHGYHFVLPSIWPISVGFNIMLLMLTFIGYTNTGNYVGLLFGLFFNLILLMSVWFRDIIEEGFMGYHTIIVQKSLRLAMILFILSEALFFACFFWAYYHNFLSPDVMILSQWPPFGIRKPCAGGIPLLNTALLLSSGVLVTWSRIELRRGNIMDALVGLEWTIFCGSAFTLLQLHEYKVSDFGISDTVYGSTFFMLTGFHGFHVIIGTILLIVSAVRCFLGHFAIRHHTGFICAIWYWHFVDAIWIFVYFSLYVNVPSHTESIVGLGAILYAR
jgi:cytochrome c oxidase subunit 3